MSTANSDLRKKISSGEYILIDGTGKSEVWKSFKIVAHKDSRKCAGYVQCVTCEDFLSYDSSKSGTSHLLRHKCSGKTPTLKLTNFFKSASKIFNKADKDSVLNSCVKMCCKDLRAFETVNGKGFIDLSQTLINIGAKYGSIEATDVLPHPTTISRHVIEMADNLRRESVPSINEKIEEGLCAATTDMWTDDFRKISYITLTLHYFDEDWKLISTLLFTSEFPEERKTGDNIRKELSSRFLQLGFNTNVMKKLIFVTDQGANMINALQPFERLDCLAHVINTILRNLFNSDVVKEKHKKVWETLAGTKSLVTFLKQSGSVNRLKKTVYQDSETRWNSKLAMLKSVYEQYEDIVNLLIEKNEEKRMEGIHMDILPKLITFLTSFNEASTSLESDKNITLPFALLWYKKLLSKCDIQEDDEEFLVDLKLKCYDLIKKKYLIRDHHKIAIFLCPSFRKLKMLETNEQQEVLNIIKMEMEKLKAADSSLSEKDSSQETSSTKRRKTDSEFSEWEDDDTSEKKGEIEIYYSLAAPSSSTEINIWWKEHEQELKTLSKLAKRFLCIPATSASSERNFSAAGFLIQDRRSRLKPEVVDAALFLHKSL